MELPLEIVVAIAAVVLVAALCESRALSSARDPPTGRPSPAKHVSLSSCAVMKSGGGKALQPTILGMATGNPPYACSQEQALAVAQKVPGIDSVQPVLGRIYGNSRIHNRYMSVPDFTPEQQLEGDEMFFNPDMKFQMPVETRLDKFREKAVPLCTKVCQDCLLYTSPSPRDRG